MPLYNFNATKGGSMDETGEDPELDFGASDSFHCLFHVIFLALLFAIR